MTIIKKTVLIVENEPIPARNLKEHLEEEGYTIIGICSTGEDAILKARENPPDIILMDIRLKGEMDGVTAYQNINQYLDVPVIYLSAYFDEKTLERAKKAGTFDFINKPARMADIDSAIAMVFYKHQMEQELNQAKEVAEKANEAKSQVIAHISHEIRNPMNVIKGLTELFDQTHLTEEQKKYLRWLKTSSEKILEIINQAMDITQIEAGKFVLDKKPFSLRTLIDNLIETHTATAERKGIELNKLFAVDVPEWIVGDPLRLKQCLSHLIENALKFTKKGSCKLEVHSDKPQEIRNALEPNKVSVVFSITDTGIGIPEAQQKDFLVNTHSQVDISGAKIFGGSGLGLAITKHLVEKMGGKISVHSIPEKGATISFSAVFEKWENLEISQSVIHSQLSEEKPTPLNILLATESLDNQDTVTALLRLHVPHNVTGASNGEAVVRLHNAKNFDLILIDITLPIYDGFKATRLIRGNKTPGFNSDVPIIALTGHTDKGDKERFLNSGMTDFLPQPFGFKELHEVIARVINNNMPAH